MSPGRVNVKLPENPRARAVGRLERHERAWWRRLSMLFSVGMALLGIAIAVATDRDPLAVTPWIEGPRALRLAWSILAGAFVATGTLVFTKELVRRSASGRALADYLAPEMRTQRASGLVLQALAAGISEELLFRGALAPLLGILASSVLFGLAHRMRGRGRILWALWSAAVGCAFAIVFVASGELLGAIVGHVAINVGNAFYLRGRERSPLALAHAHVPSLAPLAPHGDVRVES